MTKVSVFSLLLLAALCLSGCYQMHSDDDLRTIPVTNNPNIVPNQGNRLPSAPM
jgi:PBP1b-binding outer membrane lipoprotein LpoB